MQGFECDPLVSFQLESDEVVHMAVLQTGRPCPSAPSSERPIHKLDSLSLRLFGTGKVIGKAQPGQTAFYLIMINATTPGTTPLVVP